ncbi:MAG: hypothetical protein N5P05_000128 [Chroococcopsis gigantea SAG 12.99]|jgi:drug/metabolite transporter (DMT)-like permease|nr:DMT family transporter [Chlorogloea purpurea SAG 13.99]MDV2998522.1 hypothetical protein [Chroococcopsis gigantea SAG 12.99]
MDGKIIGMTAALGSAASWAVGSILFKGLGEHLSPLAMTLAKGIASIFLIALMLTITGTTAVETRTTLLLIASGLLGIALGDSFFFAALQDLSPHILIVLLMFGQVFTALLAVIFLGEMPSLTAWLGIALVISGIFLVLFSGVTQKIQGFRLRGVIFGLLSVACMSISIIIAKPALESVSAMQALFIRMLAGTLGILVFGAARGQISGWMSPFKQRKLLMNFLLSVCVITFGGFWLSLVAIKYVDVTIANTLASTEPLFVLPLTAIFLKEKITAKAIIGTIITVMGIILICFSY